MTTSSPSRGIAILSLVLLARSADAAGPNDGGLVGVVEDSRGTPVPGALVSLFGRGIRGSSLVMLTDATGRFFMPSLPAGSYTLRAMREGHHPAPVHQVTVVPDRDAVFTVNLTPVGEEPAADAKSADARDNPSERTRELRWLLRHKRRSVLEERTPGTAWADDSAQRAGQSLASAFGGSVELLANPAFAGWGEDPGGPDGAPASLSAVRLQGRIKNAAEWSLAGLVAESEATAWRIGAEFVIEPGGGHQIRAGSGYGSRFLRAQGRPAEGTEGRGVGAILLQDRFEAGDKVVATVGARLSHIGFLEQANHLDPSVSVEVRRDARTRLRGSFSGRTLAPGGDLLSLSTLASAPAISYAVTGPGLQSERAYRVEMGAEQDFGATQVSAHTYYEDVRNQLFNSFEGPAGSLRIVNAGDMASRGLGLVVSRRFGPSLAGSVTYTLGHAWRASAVTWDANGAPPPPLVESDFHDLVARLDTRVPGTATRVSALYRVARVSPAAEGQEPTLHIRFDLQMSQALPFIGSWTRADWDFLVAVRNLYYEPSEGAMLDELAVSNPPKRLLGGIAVRF
ncbi:MAG TPA: TonB-dependent receptor [Vicinamibacteria bacterium]|nr:TonB-dependent receptor [Vicinamibacteria bacterium]